jgi:hypothetical protein
METISNPTLGHLFRETTTNFQLTKTKSAQTQMMLQHKLWLSKLSKLKAKQNQAQLVPSQLLATSKLSSWLLMVTHLMLKVI